MKKNMMKKALAVLVILAMMIPFMPVIASAEASAEATAWFNGAQDKVLTISNAAELGYFSEIAATGETFANYTVKLTANVAWNEGAVVDVKTKTWNLDTETTKSWTPIAEFAGIFDGQGNTISGLYINASGTQYAFIAAIKDGTVKDVTFANCYIYNGTASGVVASAIVVGKFYGSTGSTIQNVTVEDSFLRAGNSSALIYGCPGEASAKITINGCLIKGSYIEGRNSNIGAIGGGLNAGSAVIALSNCVVDADTTVYSTSQNCGGLIGSLFNSAKPTVTIDNCHFYGTVTCKSSTNVNALVGSLFNTAVITNSSGVGVVIKGNEAETPTVLNARDYYDASSDTNDADTKTSFTLDAPADGVMSMEIEGVQTKKADTTFDARFVASIDLGEVTTTNTLIGFEFAQLGEYAADATNVQYKGCETVYKSITTTFGGEDLTAEGFGADYLATLVITGIPASGSQTILIRAMYKVDGGAAQYGNYALVTFVNGEIAASAYLTEYVAE